MIRQHGLHRTHKQRSFHNTRQSIMARSETYGKDQFQAHLSMILDKLSLYNLEEHIDEVIQNIYHEKFEHVRKDRGIMSWKVVDVINWINSLRFIGCKAQAITEKLELECIDGYCMMTLTELDWIHTLRLDYSDFYLIRVIIQGWKLGGSDWFYSPSETSIPFGKNSFKLCSYPKYR